MRAIGCRPANAERARGFLASRKLGVVGTVKLQSWTAAVYGQIGLGLRLVAGRAVDGVPGKAILPPGRRFAAFAKAFRCGRIGWISFTAASQHPFGPRSQYPFAFERFFDRFFHRGFSGI